MSTKKRYRIIARYNNKAGYSRSMICKNHRQKWAIETSYKLYHKTGKWLRYHKHKALYRSTI